MDAPFLGRIGVAMQCSTVCNVQCTMYNAQYRNCSKCMHADVLIDGRGNMVRIHIGRFRDGGEDEWGFGGAG